MIRHIIIAATIAMLLVAASPGKTRGEELPDVMVKFGCLQEQTALNLAYIWVKKGEYWFGEATSDYILNEECFSIASPGYPAYIDRVVLRLGKKFRGEYAYVVEAHFLRTPPENKFYFLLYGEPPVKARRSAA